MLASLGTITGLISQSVIAQLPIKKIYYYLNDHLGTPIKVIDESNTIVWAADYKPFGKLDITVDTFENNFRFPGQYYDTESNLHYNYHRYYQPDIGRYLRADPIELGRRINLYFYSLNNPINLFDPDGLEVSGAIVGGIAGGITGAISGAEVGGIPGAIGGAISGAIFGTFIGGATEPITGGKVGGAVGMVAGNLAGSVIGEILGPSSLAPSEKGPVIHRGRVPPPIVFYPVPPIPESDKKDPCE